MSARTALRLTRRELRGGLRGFRIFLACLILGVAAIAAVGIVRASIQAGLAEQGRVLLGGDAQMQFTYRHASEAERAFMDRVALRISEVIDFRSMAVAGEGDAAEHGLTQVKAVDGAYPLVGTVELDPPMPLDQALAGRDGLPGAVMDRVLVDRLGLGIGDTFRLGLQSFRLAAVLMAEPDSASGGFGLGPRTLVASPALADSGLIGPGTLFDTQYRLLLPPGTDLSALRQEAMAAFPDTGLRWRDSRRAAPGIERFVDRIGAFLVIVGLAGLAVGGVGVSAAIRAYLAGKTATIATLRTLGADQRVVFLTYLFQIAALTALGVGAGLVLGAAVPLALAPMIARLLPVPAVFAPWPAPLAEAAFYGIATALLFTLWPLARTARIRAAALYREAAGAAQGWPRPIWWAVSAMLAAVLIGGAVLFSGVPRLALGRRSASWRPWACWSCRPCWCAARRGSWRAGPPCAGGRRCGWRYRPSAGRGRKPPRSFSRWAWGLRCWPAWGRSRPTCAPPSTATCPPARRPISSSTSRTTRWRRSTPGWTPIPAWSGWKARRCCAAS